MVVLTTIAGTSLSLAIAGSFGLINVTAGVLNLLTTGWYIKRFGVRFAMAAQCFAPAFRITFQIFASEPNAEMRPPKVR
jgi:hypothetical protein